ncbi:MAG: M28 family peptidase [Clostridia bacterium]|nr:M28 family peptidase [Clostridia bacterium]
MKKAILVIAVVLLVALTLPTAIFAETQTDYTSTQTYQMLNEFVTAFPSRSTPQQERAVANYIANKFADFNYSVEVQSVPESAYGYATYNAIAFKDNPSVTDCIVIGAHYDCNQGTLGGGEGANDNASGVVALLQIAEQLKDVTLPFDLYIVAFGGEEQGLLGSDYFVRHFYNSTLHNSKLPLESIRVMFNMDSIANGDNLYVQVENKPTNLANLILQNATGNAKLLEKPHAVGVFNADMWGYGYYETVQNTDHTSFRLVGVPVVNFFSGNFKNWNFVESADANKNTMNTDLDKLANCNQAWIDKIDTVVSTVVSTVISTEFDEVSKNARSELLNIDFWYNRLWPKIATVVILIILTILAVLHHRKLQKQAIMGTAFANTTHIFETPSSDDIFTFKD